MSLKKPRDFSEWNNMIGLLRAKQELQEQVKLVDYYCKQGTHWIRKGSALFDAMGSPMCPKHHRKLRLSAHKKSHGDKNES